MMTDVKHASCLCGDVEFKATLSKRGMGVCHCGTCRKWTAGPFMALGCEEVVFVSEDSVGVYTSSQWGERGFCQNCGTSLFWRMHDKTMYGVSISVFENTDDIPFDFEFFIDEKPQNYEFSNPTKRLAGEECFTLFAPKPDQEQNK